MDLYLVILRIIHITAGIIWVGAAFTMLFVIYPAANALGSANSTNQFWLKFYKTTPWNLIMPVVAISTTVAGILLYVNVSDTFDSDWMKDTGNQVLSFGGIVGILAFGHGGGALGRISGEFAKLLETTLAKSDISEQEQTALAEMSQKIKRHAHIGFGLTMVAVLCMASARYI